MPLDSATRICISMLQPSTSRMVASSSIPSLRRHNRRFSRRSEDKASTSYSQRQRAPHDFQESSSLNPRTFDSKDTIDHLRKTFPPLEFPVDVAQRMTTHISWNRGLDGHNGRLGFVGRRVLHTYLLLFLHECTLPTQTPPKKAPLPPSARLRVSTFSAGTAFDPLSETYDDISGKLLNTYTLGEYVGGAWELERIMRWTPAVADFDAMEAASPHTVLRSSGLYKVRGATVEGVMGGIFHQFGGLIAHRVFHTRILPHIAHVGLPATLRSRVEDACDRFGGREGLLADPVVLAASTRRGRQREHQGEREVPDGGEKDGRESDRPSELSGTGENADYTRVIDVKQRSEQRRRLGYTG